MDLMIDNGGAVAEWSKVLPLREKMKESQKISGSFPILKEHSWPFPGLFGDPPDADDVAFLLVAAAAVVVVEAEEAEAGKEPGLVRRWNLVFVIFLVKNLSSLKLAADSPGILAFFRLP